MTPYREAPSVTEPRAPRGVPFPWRKAVCYLIALATLGPIFLQVQARQLVNPIDSVAHFAQIGWIPWLAPVGIIAWVVGVQPTASGDAKARLCRILWNCGQRGTAVGVSIGWIPLRFSEKRLDRNARAVQRFVQRRRRERYPWIKP